MVYNPASGYYFIRGFERLRELKQIKNRASVILNRKDLKTIQAFIDAALTGRLIRNQEYFWVKGKVRFRRAAFTIKDNANTLVKVDPDQLNPDTLDSPIILSPSI